MSGRAAVRVRRGLALSGIAYLVLLCGGTPVAQAAPVQPGAFDGTASAYVTRITETIPNMPVASTVIDGGGPTAQASLTSLQDGSGYAAAPDPGQFVVGAPGLVAGLLAAQAPQFPTPPMPDVPLAVVADSVTPHKEMKLPTGYSIEADKTDTSASAKAALGNSVAADIASATATSSVAVQKDGSVVATATSDVEGVKVGPVAIGSVITTAKRTLTPDGKLTNSSDIQVNALAVGGLPVPLPVGALTGVAGSSPVPLSLGPAVDALLKPLQVSIQAVKAQQTGDTVVAPALVLTGVLPQSLINGLGATSDGSYMIALGQSSVRLTGVAAPPPFTPGSYPIASGSSSAPVPTGGGATGGGATGAGAGTGSTGGGVAGPVTGSGGGSVPVATGDAPVRSGDVPVSTADVAPAQPVSTPVQDAAKPVASGPVQYALADLSKPLGLNGIYLIVVGAAAIVFVIAQLVRLWGVRGTWTSSAG